MLRPTARRDLPSDDEYAASEGTPEPESESEYYVTLDNRVEDDSLPVADQDQVGFLGPSTYICDMVGRSCPQMADPDVVFI